MHVLSKIAEQTGTDRGIDGKYKGSGNGHHYTEYYGPIFESKRDDATKILELGAYRGQGLMMWQEFFPKTNIWGIEVQEPDNLHRGLPPVYTDKDTRIKVMVGDSSKREDLIKLIEFCGEGQFDIIIDDADHNSLDQQVAMGILFPYVKSGGFYAIEDLHAYPGNHDYNGGGCDKTREMIYNLDKTSNIVSEFMEPEEAKYIQDNIDSHNFFKTGGNDASMEKLWIVKKKS